MLLFPTPYILAGAPPAGLAGYNTRIVRKSSATSQTFGGTGVWEIDVVAGELITATMHAVGNSTIINAANFLLSLGGNAMNNAVNSATTGSGIFPGSAGFWLVAPSTGTLALAADVTVSARACGLILRRITGFDPTTPIGMCGAPSKLNADALTLPGGAITVGRDGNVIIGDACTKAGTATTVSSTTLGNMGFDKTGGTTSSDLAFGFGESLVPTAGTFTPDWTFDVAGRMSAAFMQINVAP